MLVWAEGVEEEDRAKEGEKRVDVNEEDGAGEPTAVDGDGDNAEGDDNEEEDDDDGDGVTTCTARQSAQYEYANAGVLHEYRGRGR